MPRPPETADAPDAVEKLTLILASELARDGRRREAEDLLLTLPEPATPERSDLLARLRAQAGDLDAAEQYWRQIPNDDACAPAAAAGLRRIELLRRRPRWLRFNLGFGLVALAVCAAVAVGAAAAVLAVTNDNGTSAVPIASASVSSTPAGPASPTSQPTTSPASTPSATTTPTASPPELTLGSGGVHVDSRGAASIVSFRRGLFAPGGATLSSSGKKVLSSIAAGLSKAGQPFSVLVVGHTDDVPPAGYGTYANNVALGYARAAAAADFLRRHSDLPLAAFTTASAGAGDPLASNEHALGRARNRTVVIEIRAR